MYEVVDDVPKPGIELRKLLSEMTEGESFWVETANERTKVMNLARKMELGFVSHKEGTGYRVWAG